MRDTDMLSALVSAPGTMARNAGLYITVFGVALVQALIAQFVPDALALAEQAAVISPDSVMGNAVSFALAILVVFIQLALSVYILATVANVVNTPKNSAKKNPNASLGALAGFAAIVLLVGGSLLAVGLIPFYFIFVTSGIVTWILFFFVLLIVLALFAGLILFGFAPTFMGKGFSLREALAQSWKFSTKHLFGTVLLFLALIFISGIAETIITLALEPLTNEWVILLVNTLFAALLAFYGATVLANAIPANVTPESTVSAPRRSHK